MTSLKGQELGVLKEVDVEQGCIRAPRTGNSLCVGRFLDGVPRSLGFDP